MQKCRYIYIYMRRTLLFFALIAFCVAPVFSCGQSLVGQSKKYILNFHASCYIIENIDTIARFDCANGYESIFIFNQGDGLCNFYTYGCSKEDAEVVYAKLKSSGLYRIVPSSKGVRFLSNKLEVQITQFGDADYSITCHYSMGYLLEHPELFK